MQDLTPVLPLSPRPGCASPQPTQRYRKQLLAYRRAYHRGNGEPRQLFGFRDLRDPNQSIVSDPIVVVNQALAQMK